MNKSENSRDVNLQILNEAEFEFDDGLLSDIKNATEKALEYACVNMAAEISLTMTNGNAIRNLNKRYRGIDLPTDVLSFPQYENIDEINNSPAPVTLGDIVINIEAAKSQAAEYGHSLRRELCFLTLHGALHLLGYDHVTEGDDDKMTGIQNDILNKLNINR